MSVALATKGIIAGLGGGLYPSDYVASAINILIDLEQETTVAITQPSLGVSISLSESVSVAISDDPIGVAISVDDENLEVTI